MRVSGNTVSTVLRKKIEAATGIPPSILRAQRFWDGLLSGVRGWAEASLGAQADVRLGSRRIELGPDVPIILESGYSHAFAADVAPGLCALAFDDAVARLNASRRLQQDIESLGETSTLFLRLLSEQPAVVLWQRLGGALHGHVPSAGTAALADWNAATGGFSDGTRYLLAELVLDLSGKTATLTLIFDLNYVKHVNRNSKQTGKGSGQASASAREALRDRVRETAVTIDAVIDRLSLTLGACADLKVGQVLPLPEADPSRLSLMAETVDGSVEIGAGELGVLKQQRALKLTTAVNASFAGDIPAGGSARDDG